MKIIFKNLQKSEYIAGYIQEKIAILLEQFPKMKSHHVRFLFSKNQSKNRKAQAAFATEVIITGKYYKNIFLKKQSINLYMSLSEVLNLISHKLNNVGDKQRIKKIKSARKIVASKKTFGLQVDSAQFDDSFVTTTIDNTQNTFNNGTKAA